MGLPLQEFFQQLHVEYAGKLKAAIPGSRRLPEELGDLRSKPSKQSGRDPSPLQCGDAQRWERIMRSWDLSASGRILASCSTEKLGDAALKPRQRGQGRPPSKGAATQQGFAAAPKENKREKAALCGFSAWAVPL